MTKNLIFVVLAFLPHLFSLTNPFSNLANNVGMDSFTDTELMQLLLLLNSNKTPVTGRSPGPVNNENNNNNYNQASSDQMSLTTENEISATQNSKILSDLKIQVSDLKHQTEALIKSSHREFSSKLDAFVESYSNNLSNIQKLNSQEAIENQRTFESFLGQILGKIEEIGNDRGDIEEYSRVGRIILGSRFVKHY